MITDSVSQHGDLLEHNGSSESLNVLRYEAELPLNAAGKSKMSMWLMQTYEWMDGQQYIYINR